MDIEGTGYSGIDAKGNTKKAGIARLLYITKK